MQPEALYLARMVHGLLQDRHQEFFIQRTAAEEGAGQEGSDAAGTIGDITNQDTYDAAEWHNGFQVCLQQCLLHICSFSWGFGYCNSKYSCLLGSVCAGTEVGQLSHKAWHRAQAQVSPL